MSPCQHGASSAAQKIPLSRCHALSHWDIRAYTESCSFIIECSHETSSLTLVYHACLPRDLDPETHVLLEDYMSAYVSASMCCAKQTLQLVQVWDAQTKRCLFSMASHTMAITAVKWGGDERIYTAARDCSINVWDAQVRAVFSAQVSAKQICL